MAEGKKVLIVEDDEYLRSLAVKRLEKDGYLVTAVADGETALKAAKEGTDIILLDLLLPGMSGYEILEKLRVEEGTKNTPIIVFSNLGQKEDLEKAKALGANDFLIKANFTLDDVVGKLQEFLK
ncbi:MAG: response regulator [Candidatus Vogelbacteria bacterium]|nr:response regulator [Candidatus Vogelbacteria bacterium]